MGGVKKQVYDGAVLTATFVNQYLLNVSTCVHSFKNLACLKLYLQKEHKKEIQIVRLFIIICE